MTNDQSMMAVSSKWAALNSNLCKNRDEDKEFKTLVLEYFIPKSSRCTSPQVTRKANNSMEVDDDEYLKNGFFNFFLNQR